MSTLLRRMAARARGEAPTLRPEASPDALGPSSPEEGSADAGLSVLARGDEGRAQLAPQKDQTRGARDDAPTSRASGTAPVRDDAPFSPRRREGEAGPVRDATRAATAGAQGSDAAPWPERRSVPAPPRPPSGVPREARPLLAPALSTIERPHLPPRTSPSPPGATTTTEPARPPRPAAPWERAPLPRRDDPRTAAAQPALAPEPWPSPSVLSAAPPSAQPTASSVAPAAQGARSRQDPGSPMAAPPPSTARAAPDPTPQAAPPSPRPPSAPAPEINITIGTVEVRGRTPAPRAAPPRPRSPTLSLADYLAGRRGGRP